MHNMVDLLGREIVFLPFLGCNCNCIRSVFRHLHMLHLVYLFAILIVFHISPLQIFS
jgi:surface polysaccharide O-acyltransferase-like enzyme